MPRGVRPSDAAARQSTAGYELKTGSPAVDAGTPGALAAGESATDVGGLNRMANATCTGAARRDRGAYELQAPPCPAPPPPAGGDAGGTPPPAATDTVGQEAQALQGTQWARARP
jgi:hypothetical protein